MTDGNAARIGAFREALRFREFRLFWLASAVSLTGDQLTFIALPWLVLKLTGDAFAMGAVLAIAAVPRAIFMLLGGVVVDRFSPRVVMIVSNAVRMALVLILALTTWQESISMGLVYVVALLFGLADAFMFPAASAFPPRLLPPEQLAAGNSLFQGTAQITLIIGPLLAGGLIVLFGGQSAGESGESAIQDAIGLAYVFAIDTLSFVVPLLILLVIRDRFPPEKTVTSKIWSTLVEGLRYTWEDLPLRTFVILIAFLSLFFRGPFFVGIPVFADAMLPEGAAGFGILMSALGVGSILGTLLAGMTKHPSPSRLGLVLLLDFFGFGCLFLFMTQVPRTWPIAAVVLISAVVDGYVIILITTWIQRRVDREKLGRVMSVIMLASQGLFPVSAAVAGALAGWTVTGMLAAAGWIMIAITLTGVLLPGVRRMGYAAVSPQKPR